MSPMFLNLNIGLKGYDPFRPPIYLGIDEHTLHKGQRFCTTFCDLKNRRVFDIQPGRSEADLACFLAKLKGRERVKVVCTDLSGSYRSLVRRFFPTASTKSSGRGWTNFSSTIRSSGPCTNKCTSFATS